MEALDGDNEGDCVNKGKLQWRRWGCSVLAAVVLEALLITKRLDQDVVPIGPNL